MYSTNTTITTTTTTTTTTATAMYYCAETVVRTKKIKRGSVQYYCSTTNITGRCNPYCKLFGNGKTFLFGPCQLVIIFIILFLLLFIFIINFNGHGRFYSG